MKNYLAPVLSSSCLSPSPLPLVAIVIFSCCLRNARIFVSRNTVAAGLRLRGLFCTRKDSISAEIMALCIVRRPCGSGGTGSIRCRPISLQLVPTNIR